MAIDRMAELRTRAATLSNEIDAIYATASAEKRPLNADENAALKMKNLEYEPLVASIESYDQHEITKGGLNKAQRPTEGPQASTEKGLRVVGGGTPREAGKPFASLGEQLFAVRNATMGGADADPRLHRLNSEIRAASGMSEGVPSDGGFAVQTDFVQSIIGRIFDTEVGGLASRVRRVEVGANANGLKQNVVDETSRVNGSRWGGVQGYWAAEADTVTASKPKLRQIQMDLEKLFALWYLTDELSQDATALSSVAERAFAEEIQFKVEDGIVNGTGTGQLLGIVGHPSLVEQAIESTQTIANTPTFIAANTAKMLARFCGSRSSAVWLANPTLFPQIALATMGSTAVPVYLNSGNIATAPFGTLWGIPILFTEYSAAEGTPGDLLLVDPDAYLMIAKGAPKFANSMHVRFLNDEQTFKVTFRVNGQPVPNSAVTPYKGSLTRSPFVSLGTRS